MAKGIRGKYTPEIVERLLKAIRLGMAYKHAAAYAGISEDTFYTWMKEKTEFSEQVKEAEADGIATNFAKIQKAATNGSWQASAWILERRHPEEYGRQRLEITGANGDPIRTQTENKIDLSSLSTEQLIALANSLKD